MQLWLRSSRTLGAMEVKRVANKVTKSFLMDPYAMLMHYKRAFKLMKLMKADGAKAPGRPLDLRP